MSQLDQPLDTVLEECRQRLAGGETVEDCLAAYPSHAAALRELLPLLAPLRALAASPDPSFAHAARQRFHTRLREAQAQQHTQGILATPRRWLRRIAIPLAAIVALGGSGFGLVTASADVLPGSPLFPVQQARDRVVQHLARSPAQQATYQLGLAAHRLQLVRRAEVERASPVIVNELIAGMLQATNRAAQELPAVPEPQRQRILNQATPLLQREERVLAAEQHRASPPSSAIIEQRRRQLAAAQKRLQAEQLRHAVTPQPAPTGRAATAPPATPSSVARAAAHANSVRLPVANRGPAASPAPSATPPSLAVRRTRHGVPTRAPQSMRLFHRPSHTTRQSVHFAAP